MTLAKLRPVGSRVPDLPARSSGARFPWSRCYHTVYLNSGTAALAIAAHLCRSLCKPQSRLPQIILPAYGCPDLIAALIAFGIRPVLVDVSPGVPWMCLTSVERAVTENTVAIMGVGFLGVPDRLAALRAIAYRAGLLLIEDSAQVMPPGSAEEPLADFCVLSFGRGKPVNLMGGGALLVRRDHLPASLPVIENLEQIDLEFGLSWRLRRQIFNLLLAPGFYGPLERIPQLGLGKTVFRPLSGAYRLNNLEGLLKRGYAGLIQRPPHHHQYMDAFGFLSGQGWQFPLQPSSPRCLLRFPLLAPTPAIRNTALAELNRWGIGASAFYQHSLPGIDGVEMFVESAPKDFPNAEDFASRLLTLPIHEDVTQANVDVMARVLAGVSRHALSLH